MIHALIDTTRVVGSVEAGGVTHEVCAEAVGNHDRGESLLTVNLRAFLRTTEHGHLGETTTPDWLPAPQVVKEHASAEEAHALVDDVFASWCHRVADAIP
jgi:hypothetical protein